MQWVIQSVGRRQKAAGSEGFTRAGASSRLVIYMLPPRNVTNLAQKVDMAICARILHRAQTGE